MAGSGRGVGKKPRHYLKLTLLLSHTTLHKPVQGLGVRRGSGLDLLLVDPPAPQCNPNPFKTGAGREEGARVVAAKTLSINPQFAWRGYGKSRLYKDANITERMVQSFRKAGLPD